jgi:hypothetical protein
MLVQLMSPVPLLVTFPRRFDRDSNQVLLFSDLEFKKLEKMVNPSRVGRNFLKSDDSLKKLCGIIRKKKMEKDGRNTNDFFS